MITMSMTEYLSRPEVSASGLSMILENARKYKLTKDGVINFKSKETDIGQVFHAKVLEPDLYKTMFVLSDAIKESTFELLKVPSELIRVVDVHHKSCKEYRQAKEESPESTIVLPWEFDALQKLKALSDKIFLSSDDMALMEQMYKKVMGLPKFKEFLEVGHKEKVFIGEIGGVKIRIRPDLLVPFKDGHLVFDLKTSRRECTKENFAKDSGENDYFMSEAVYRHILDQNGINVLDFAYVVVSKVEWSGAAYFRHNQMTVLEGEKYMYNALEKFKYCNANDKWLENDFDFYTNKFHETCEVQLPTYVFYKYDLKERYEMAE